MIELVFATYIIAVISVVWTAYSYYTLKEEIKNIEKRLQTKQRLEEVAKTTKSKPTKLVVTRNPWA